MADFRITAELSKFSTQGVIVCDEQISKIIRIAELFPRSSGRFSEIESPRLRRGKSDDQKLQKFAPLCFSTQAVWRARKSHCGRAQGSA